MTWNKEVVVKYLLRQKDSRTDTCYYNSIAGGKAASGHPVLEVHVIVIMMRGCCFVLRRTNKQGTSFVYLPTM